MNVDIDGRFWRFDSNDNGGRMIVIRDVGDAWSNVCTVLPEYTARDLVLRLVDYSANALTVQASSLPTSTTVLPPSCCRRYNWYQAGDTLTFFQTRTKNAAFQHYSQTLVIRDIKVAGDPKQVRLTFENGVSYSVGCGGDILFCGPEWHSLPDPSYFTFLVTQDTERRLRNAAVTKRNREILHEILVAANEEATDFGMGGLMNIPTSYTSDSGHSDTELNVIPSRTFVVGEDCQVLHFGLVRGESAERWMLFERKNGIDSSSYDPHGSSNNAYTEYCVERGREHDLKPGRQPSWSRRLCETPIDLFTDIEVRCSVNAMYSSHNSSLVLNRTSCRIYRTILYAKLLMRGLRVCSRLTTV